MQRRSFLVAGALVVVARAYAQEVIRRPRVGVMLAAPIPNSLMHAFEQEMLALGHANGRNIELVYRSAEGNPERFPGIADELVKLKVDVIVSGGGGPAASAAKRATRSIPIVFPATADPVAEGLVQSLAHPGGNATGLAMLEGEISAKRFEIVRELVPRLERLAILVDPKMRTMNVSLEGMRRAGSSERHSHHRVPSGRPSSLRGGVRRNGQSAAAGGSRGGFLDLQRASREADRARR